VYNGSGDVHTFPVASMTSLNRPGAAIGTPECTTFRFTMLGATILTIEFVNQINTPSPSTFRKLVNLRKACRG
jgi:hypothetical protein